MKSIKQTYIREVLKEAGAPTGGVGGAIAGAPFDAVTQQKLSQALGLAPSGGMNKAMLVQLMTELLNGLDDNKIAQAYQNVIKKNPTIMTSK